MGLLEVYDHYGQEEPWGIQLRLEGAREGGAAGVAELAKEAGTVELIKATSKRLTARLANVDELSREGRLVLRRIPLELSQHIDARQFER